MLCRTEWRAVGRTDVRHAIGWWSVGPSGAHAPPRASRHSPSAPKRQAASSEEACHVHRSVASEDMSPGARGLTEPRAPFGFNVADVAQLRTGCTADDDIVAAPVGGSAGSRPAWRCWPRTPGAQRGRRAREPSATADWKQPLSTHDRLSVAPSSGSASRLALCVSPSSVVLLVFLGADATRSSAQVHHPDARKNRESTVDAHELEEEAQWTSACEVRWRPSVCPLVRGLAGVASSAAR